MKKFLEKWPLHCSYIIPVFSEVAVFMHQFPPLLQEFEQLLLGFTVTTSKVILYSKNKDMTINHHFSIIYMANYSDKLVNIPQQGLSQISKLPSNPAMIPKQPVQPVLGISIHTAREPGRGAPRKKGIQYNGNALYGQ